MINRKLAPDFVKISNINLPSIENLALDNGVPVYFLKSGDQDVIKIDFIFDAGSAYHPCPLVAGATNSLLLEGTQYNSGTELANIFDFHGALVQTMCDHDYGSLSLITLKKHAEKILPLISGIFYASVFPETDLNIYLQKRKQNYIIASGKIKILAKRKFNELLFGNEHPYGRIIQDGDFEQVNKTQLLNFYNQYYTSKNCRIIASGKIDADLFDLLNKNFGNHNWAKENIFPKPNATICPSNTKDFFVDHKDALQSAIQIGRQLFTKSHPDYKGMLVLNTILGGYFGSRLMTNIREEKAYTYGIGSSMVNFKNTGYFTIFTEVGTNVTLDALKEIYIEIEKLQNELVPFDELERVKNYMAGELLNLFDGPFAQADTFRALNDYGLGFDFYKELATTIWSISDIEIRDLACKYLSRRDLYQVVSGNRLTVFETKK